MVDISSLMNSNQKLTFSEMQSHWEKEIKKKEGDTIDYAIYSLIFNSSNPKKNFRKFAGKTFSKNDIFSLANKDGEAFNITTEDLKRTKLEKHTENFYLGVDKKNNQLLDYYQVLAIIEQKTQIALKELSQEDAKFGQGNYKYEGAASSDLTDYQALDLMDKKLDNKVNIEYVPFAKNSVSGYYDHRKHCVGLVVSNTNFNDLVGIKRTLIHESVHARDNDGQGSITEEEHAIIYSNQRVESDSRAMKIPGDILTESEYILTQYSDSPSEFRDWIKKVYPEYKDTPTSPGHGEPPNPRALKAP